MGTEFCMTKTKAFLINQVVLVFFYLEKTIFGWHKNNFKIDFV
jgi:hypothetical protein